MISPSRPLILIVDDSAVVRTLVRSAIDTEGTLQVAAAVGDGAAALKFLQTQAVSAVLLDLEMPVMGGLETLEHLRREHPRLPVIVFSSLTARGAQATIGALERGAIECLEKPMTGGAELSRIIQNQLVPLVQEVLRTRAPERRSPPPATSAAQVGSPAPAPAASDDSSPLTSTHFRQRLPTLAGGREPGPVDLLVIGSSTGGPEALTQVLTALPADLAVPVLVVQHMPPVFTRTLAQRLDEKCALQVKEAQEGDVLVPGQVYIAPGGKHMLIRKQVACHQVRLTEDPPENSCRPAVDPTLRSAAEHFGGGLMAVVLTGMGQDGALGCQRVKERGGRVYIQDRESCVVWGMPGAVHALGCFDDVLPLVSIAGTILRIVGRGERTSRRA